MKGFRFGRLEVWVYPCHVHRVFNNPFYFGIEFGPLQILWRKGH